jgi:hypothetical protein
MALTKTELIDSLRNEVRILLHLAGKIEPSMVDYRPTPTQRSTLELLQYLSMMGPALIAATKGGAFDAAVWTAAEQAASARDLAQTLAEIATLADRYESSLGAMSDADLAAEIAPFGFPTSRGAFIVNYGLSGHAAYRTQLFCYLKACGRTELGTMNLWGGKDPGPVPA